MRTRTCFGPTSPVSRVSMRTSPLPWSTQARVFMANPHLVLVGCWPHPLEGSPNSAGLCRREKIGVLGFDRWKIVHDQPQMFAHRTVGLIRRGLFDRIDDGGVLADELALRKASQREVTNSIHLKLDVFDDFPAVKPPGRVRKGPVKLLVQPHEIVELACSHSPLGNELLAQPGNKARIAFNRYLSHDVR